MKIQSVNNSLLKMYKLKQDKINNSNNKNELRTVDYAANPKLFIRYNNITFKSDRISPDEIYKQGYEDIKLDKNGKILNKAKYLVINTSDDIIALARTPDSMSKKYILNEDIDFKDKKYIPIGKTYFPFTGSINGNGHSIKNIEISDNNSYAGCFGATENALIQNLVIENIRIKGKDEIGGLIGNAKCTNIKNCRIENSDISGIHCVGGIIGAGQFNNITDVSCNANIEELRKQLKLEFGEINSDTKNCSTSFIGGFIGYDLGSEIKNSYSECKVTGDYSIGGFVGATSDSIPTKISNSWFNGELISKNSAGGFIGSSSNAVIQNSSSLKYPLIATGISLNINNLTSINNIDKINLQLWDSTLWNCADYTIPRIKSVQQNQNPINIFLEDINNAITLNVIKNFSVEYTPPEYLEIDLGIKPPKHYPENDEKLKGLKDSINIPVIYKDFARYTDRGCTIWGDDITTTDRNDELLVELLKNKNLPININYPTEIITEIAGFGWGESTGCSPLYVTSRIGRPYIFKEALKRDDINMYVKTIFGGAEIYDTLMKYPDDSSVYVLFASQNPIVKEYVKYKMEHFPKNQIDKNSRLLNILYKMYPNIPDLDEQTGKIKIPRKYIVELENIAGIHYADDNTYINNLNDVLSNLNIPNDFRDSNGNNFINTIPYVKDKTHALDLYVRAIARGIDANNKNNNGDNAMGILLKTEQNQNVLARMLDDVENIYQTNENDENAIHIFSKNPNELEAVNYIDYAINNGMSLNMQDNEGKTALMNAVKMQNINLIKYLISKGADVNIIDINGQNALHYATLDCNNSKGIEIIKTLLSANSNIEQRDSIGNKPFDYLPETLKKPEILNYEPYCNMLKNSGIDDNEEPTKDITLIKQNKVNKDISINTLLEKLDTGLTKGEQNDYLTNLLYKIHKNSVELPENINGHNILHILAKINSPLTKQCIKSICELTDTNINMKNEFEETPLMVAVNNFDMAENNQEKFACLDNIQSLLYQKVDVNTLDSNSQNVMHTICQGTCLLLFAKLLDLDVNINQKDSLGKIPLDYLSDGINDSMKKFYEEFLKSKKITVLKKI